MLLIEWQAEPRKLKCNLQFLREKAVGMLYNALYLDFWSELLMIANQNDLLVAGCQAGQYVSFQDLSSFFNNHNF